MSVLQDFRSPSRLQNFPQGFLDGLDHLPIVVPKLVGQAGHGQSEPVFYIRIQSHLVSDFRKLFADRDQTDLMRKELLRSEPDGPAIPRWESRAVPGPGAIRVCPPRV